MATSLGIGSCWIGSFEEQAVRDILHIPSNMKLIALIASGYEIGRASVPPRLPLSSIVHREAFNRAGAPGIVAKIKKSGPVSVLGKLLRVLINRR